MHEKVLVAYATKHGMTAEIAERCGAVLRRAGLSVDVLPVEEVKNVADYGPVILGSAVYIGRWRKEAVKFIKRHENRLKERRVWLFSSGPTGTGDPAELLKGWEFPTNIQEVIERIEPVEIVVFHGALNPERLNFLERMVIKRVEAPTGDFRDWEAITAWAKSIAALVGEKVVS